MTVTTEQFDRALIEILSGMDATSIINIPGVYEAVSEEYNNEAIDRAQAKHKRYPAGIKRSPWLDENIMLEAPHVIAETNECHPRLANLCELIADVDRLHGRPPGDFSHIPLHCPDDQFFEDEENCCQIEGELLEHLEEFLPPFTYFYHEDDAIAIQANVEQALDDLLQEGVFFNDADPKTSDEPGSNYSGLWLHSTDHGNATLFLRDYRGEDHEIWAVV